MASGLARAGFDLDLKYGKEAEGMLAEILSLKGGKIEVKRDEQCLKTGNLFVELATKKNGKEIKSGYFTSQADWWAFVFRPNRFLLMKSDELHEYIMRAVKEDKIVWGGDNNRFKGVLIPIKWVVKE